MKNKRIAVYGSLREGHYNFERFKRFYPELTVVENNVKIKGYDLYSLGSYPGIVRGNGEIEVDILECSKQCYGQIMYMELGAGYTAKELFINDHQTIIFEYEGPVRPHVKVESGNWNQFTKQYTNV